MDNILAVLYCQTLIVDVKDWLCCRGIDPVRDGEVMDWVGKKSILDHWLSISKHLAEDSHEVTRLVVGGRAHIT